MLTSRAHLLSCSPHLPLRCEIEDEFDDACLPASVVSAYLSELTRDSRKFCSKELEITHKGLIKEQRKAGGKANAPGVLAAFARQKGRGI